MTDTNAAKMGRPTKYDPAFCDVVRDAMGRGYSKTATAGYQN